MACGQLRVCCYTLDLVPIRKLFAAGRLDVDDAITALEGDIACHNIQFLRCLLEHGADPTNINIR